MKDLTKIVASLGMVTFFVILIFVCLYIFTINASVQFATFLKDLPVAQSLIIAGTATAITFIKNKYKTPSTTHVKS